MRLSTNKQIHKRRERNIFICIYCSKQTREEEEEKKTKQNASFFLFPKKLMTMLRTITNRNRILQCTAQQQEKFSI